MKAPTFFKTIDEDNTGYFKDRGSKFYGYAHPVKTEEDVQQYLAILGKEHVKARHFCYAYRLGTQGENYRINDDGEPSGSAGKPIYGTLLKNEFTDILVVVVRYFGGTKLGVPGLINAYRSAAAEALEDIKSKTIMIGERATFEADYSLSANIIDEGKKLDMQLVGQEFGASVKTTFVVPTADFDQRLMWLCKSLTNLTFDTLEEYGQWVKVELT